MSYGRIYICLPRKNGTWRMSYTGTQCKELFMPPNCKDTGVSSSSAVVERKYGFSASLSSSEYRTVDLN